MNIIGNSLFFSLRALCLRRHGDIGFGKRCRKFFSINNNSVQFMKSSGVRSVWMKNEPGIKTGRLMNDANFDEEEEEEEDSGYGFGEGESKSNGDNYNDVSDGLFRSKNYMKTADENEINIEDWEGVGLQNKGSKFGDNARGKNHEWHHEKSHRGYKRFNKTNVDDYNGGQKLTKEMLLEKYKKSHVYNYINISVQVPPASPIFRNVIKPPKKGYTDHVFYTFGKRFIGRAMHNGVEPLKLFYCDPEVFMHYKFIFRNTEFYLIDGAQVEKLKENKSTFLCGVFSKHAVRNLALQAQVESPITLVYHGSIDVFNTSLIFNAAYSLGGGKLITTTGSTTVYSNKTIEKCVKGLFEMPVYDNVRWNEIDQLIDSDCEVFLFDPGAKDNPSAIPAADIFTIDLKAKKKIFLIICHNAVEEDEALLEYCKKWKARRPIFSGAADLSPYSTAVMTLWEIKRQFTL